MWFSKSAEEALKELDVDPAKGLSDEKADARLIEYGPNKIQGRKKKTLLQLFVAQLRDTLIYVLFAAVAVTLLMGEYVDALIIVLVIIVNAVLGVVQEMKAGRAIEALQKISSPKALVKRGGAVREVSSEKVVPGDILILDAGRFVAADLRLIESANLQINESALTGESAPSEKDGGSIPDDPRTPIGDRTNMAFMSTLVTYGRGVGVAVQTGMRTEVGKIADVIDNEEGPTPLEKRLDELGATIGKLAIGICLLIFFIAMLQGRDLATMFLTAVSLAVASIPEGLAAIVAIVLSIGVTTMSKRNAIIKRLPAVETLGSVNVVCADKTGTLTQNRMTVKKYFTFGGGEVAVGDGAASDDATLLAKAMVLCSDATFEQGAATGDPTEIALLVLGDELRIDRKKLDRTNRRVAEFAFDSDRKLMSTLMEENGGFTVYTKGAVDSLLGKCTRVLEGGKVIPITEAHERRCADATEEMSGDALRTLAAAYRSADAVMDPADMEKDLIFLGLVGMIDPPREEAKPSIQKARRAGIATIMITGDHKNTAFAIARDLGIAETMDQVITGREIDGCSDEGLAANIDRFRVFARVSPQHKVRIVQALKSHGNIVSMTGDGVNDAPSLNAADIGVAMGIAGTDVAKGASDMILMDDNFATIVSAIEQGRNIYSNIKKSVLFLLTSNLGEVITVFCAILVGFPAPLLATQLLWINLLTDSLPAVALGMDPGDPDVMGDKPRDPKESFFAHGAIFRVLAGGALIGALTIFAFWYGCYERGYSPRDSALPEDVTAYARTLAFMTIIACQLLYSFSFRNSRRSILSVGVFSNRYLVGAVVLGFALQLVVIGIPWMREAFKLEVLPPSGWLYVIALGWVPLLGNEAVKAFWRVGKRASGEVQAQ